GTSIAMKTYKKDELVKKSNLASGCHSSRICARLNPEAEIHYHKQALGAGLKRVGRIEVHYQNAPF
ncbi:MAG: hypothetical protein PVG26_20740, partial [Desulfobacterales bacterium]